MLMDTDNLDIIKGITRKEAKAVHKDLPEGGVWRTIKGHHVYIKDGKVLAGSIPGVTKPKKATKAHLKEHQAHVDSEGKKKGTKKDAKGKSATASKTAKSKPSGSGAKKAASGKTGAKKAGKDSAGGKTAKQVKGKANGTTKVGAKTDGKKSVKPTAKSGTTGKSVSATGKKKTASEGGAKSKPAAKKGGLSPELKEAQKLAKKSPEAFHFLSAVMTHPDSKFREAIQTYAKKQGKTVTQLYEDWNPSKAGEKKPDGKKGATSKDAKSKPAAKKEVNPELVLEKARKLAKENGIMQWLDELGTEGQDVVRAHSYKVGKSVVELHREWSEEDMPKENKNVEMGRDVRSDELELYHGTELARIDVIKKQGFKLNGGHSDFGNAAYFKSPHFDPLDHKEHQDWIAERDAAGKHIPPDERAKRGYDTADVVDFFTEPDYPGVIKATIPKEHVLDCTKGRPKELQDLITDHFNHEEEGTIEAMMGFVLKHIVGMDTTGMNEDQLDAVFNQPDMQKALKNFWGRPLHPFRVSPYEVYAKKKGIKAIVDKLDAFKYEGWQIGVYDPSLIKIVDQGKEIRYNDEKRMVELIKALQKAGVIPYCLLGFHFDGDHLHLHIGAAGKKDVPEGVKKSLMKRILASGSGDVSAVYDKELRKARIALSKGHDLFSSAYREKLGAGLAYVVSNYNAGKTYLTTGVQRKRSAYQINWMAFDEPVDEVLYIPINRLNVVYQTEAATDWDKVNENADKMKRGVPLAPVVIGLDYDIHDGHHRYEASKMLGYEHVPCVVKGGNDVDRRRALESYQELWKAIQTDPTDPRSYNNEGFMFRGVGLRELHAINKSKFIQSKGKGNDDDKGTNTCFSNLFQQAEGYARSQYDLYDEKAAFVLVVNRGSWIEEDEHGELISDRPIPSTYIYDIIPVPKDERENQ